MDKLLSEATPKEMTEELQRRGVIFVMGMLPKDAKSDGCFSSCCHSSVIVGLGMCELIKERLLIGDE